MIIPIEVKKEISQQEIFDLVSTVLLNQNSYRLILEMHFNPYSVFSYQSEDGNSLSPIGCFLPDYYYFKKDTWHVGYILKSLEPNGEYFALKLFQTEEFKYLEPHMKFLWQMQMRFCGISVPDEKSSVIEFLINFGKMFNLNVDHPQNALILL